MSEIDVLTHHELMLSNPAYAKPPHSLFFAPTRASATHRGDVEAGGEDEVIKRKRKPKATPSVEKTQEPILEAAKSEGFSSPVRKEFAWALPTTSAASTITAFDTQPAPSARSLFSSRPTWAHFSPATSGISVSRKITVTAKESSSGDSLAPSTPVPASRKKGVKASGVGRVLQLGGGVANTADAAAEGGGGSSESVRSEDEVDELATPKAVRKSKPLKANPSAMRAGASGSGLRQEVSGEEQSKAGDVAAVGISKGKKRSAGENAVPAVGAAVEGEPAKKAKTGKDEKKDKVWPGAAT